MGPPVTPFDPMLRLVRLPITAIAVPPPPPPKVLLYQTLQQQFRSTLPQWQLILFGSLQKAYSNNTLYNALVGKQPIMIVSDASIQNNGQSGFAWVIAKDTTPLWRGLRLVPSPANDMYSG